MGDDPMKTLLAALLSLSALLAAGEPVAATWTLTVAADSTFAGTPGKIMHEVFTPDIGDQEDDDLAVIVEDGLVRVLGVRMPGEDWMAFPEGCYFVAANALSVGASWSGLPDVYENATVSTVTGTVSITVPAGHFPTAYLVENRVDGGPHDQKLVANLWFVPGVGLVYEENYTLAGDLEYYQELVSYTAAGTGVMPMNVGNTWSFVEYSGGTSAVGGGDLPASPVQALGARPNPFNPQTKVAFALAAGGSATVRIHDAAGRLVAVLVDGFLDAGRHEVTWNGRDMAGRQVGSGVYMAMIESAGHRAVSRMTLVK